MPRYKLTIAYDGTDFCGWQKQEPPEGVAMAPHRLMAAHEGFGQGAAGAGDSSAGRVIVRTVQEVVERAVREAVREPVVLLGASRTDSGVHARGQVGVFSCGGGDGPDEPSAQAEGSSAPAAEDPVLAPRARQSRGTGWPESRGVDTLVRAINSRLPEDVLVTRAEVVADGFHPIADCVGKGYSYTLHVSPHRPLWDRRFVHQVWVPLDVGAMSEAASRFVGEHDFAAFAAAGHGRVTTVRTVFECRVVEERDAETERRRDAAARDREKRVRLEISGNGFLWNMVRIVAGTLVEVGRGKLRPEDVTAAIEGRDRRKAGPTLPAQGLCLEWVKYGDPVPVKRGEPR